MHLARAARAGSRLAEIGALRDAMRWAGEDPELQQAGRRGTRQGAVGSGEGRGHRDRARSRRSVREAAELLVTGDDHALAGEALEAIGDHLAAANAYSAGGLVERMEHALSKDDDLASEHARTRSTRSPTTRPRCASAAATTRAPSSCAPLAPRPAPASTAASSITLDTALLTAGKVELRRRGKPLIVACAARQARARSRSAVRPDAACRRRVAPARRDRARRQAVPAPRSRLAQRHLGRAGCRSPAACRSPATVRFGLGDECNVDFEIDDERADPSRSRSGLDRGVALIAGDEGQQARARAGRARHSTSSSSAGARCSGAEPQGRVCSTTSRSATVRVQLIRGDRIGRRRRRDRGRLTGVLVAASVRQEAGAPGGTRAGARRPSRSTSAARTRCSSRSSSPISPTASAATRSAAPTCCKQHRRACGPRGHERLAIEWMEKLLGVPEVPARTDGAAARVARRALRAARRARHRDAAPRDLDHRGDVRAARALPARRARPPARRSRARAAPLRGRARPRRRLSERARPRRAAAPARGSRGARSPARRSRPAMSPASRPARAIAWCASSAAARPASCTSRAMPSSSATSRSSCCTRTSPARSAPTRSRGSSTRRA